MPTAEQVAEFLRQNPGFFENHADILINLQIPHPHGGRAVSIGERQLVAVREKAKLLEDKLRELIAFGEENDAVGAKVHRLSCRLIQAPSLDGALDTTLFVTHDVSEAVYLGDAVYVLSSRPARILHRVTVPYFPVRDAALKSATEFRAVEKQLLDLLYAPQPRNT